MTLPAGDVRRPPPATPSRSGGAGGLWAALVEAATAAAIGRREDPLRGLDEAQAARIRAAQVASVVRLTPLSMAVNLLNTGLVAFVFWDTGPRWLLAAWAALLAFLAGAAVWKWRAGKRRPQRGTASRRATARTLAHGAVFAAVWGVAPAALFPGAGPFERFVLGCLATSMIAGGAFALSGVPRAGLAYSWILCLLTAAGMASCGDAAMAVAAAVLCFYATIISRNLVTYGDLFAANLRGRAENEAQREVLGLLLRDFEESAGDCLWETDAAGRLRRCSPRLALMLGLDPDAAAGAVLPGLLREDGRPYGAGSDPAGDPAVARFAAREAFRDLLAKVPAADGGERVLSLTAKPVLDAAGAFAGFRGVASDVTERVRAEADLARTRALLDAVVENVPAVLFAKDMEDGGRYVLLNREGERVLNCRRDAVVGRTDRDLFGPEEAARFAENDRRAVEAAAAGDPAARCVPEEAALAAGGGEVRHLRTRKIALAAPGAPGTGPGRRYVLGLSEDVTERKRDEERLREQHRRLDAALTHMSQGLGMFDADRRLVVCNRRLLEMYGLPDGFGACGTPLRAMVEESVARGNHPGISADYILADYEARLAGSQPGTLLARLADGRSVALSFRPLADGGAVVTFEDVSEQRRSEALIREQNERLRAREEELAAQNGLFRTAIENMSQGLCFFDGEKRLVVCNTRYAELYRLSPEQVRPGTPVRAILEHRAASGTAPKGRSLAEYAAWSSAVVASSAASDVLVELADGRAVAIHNEAMPGGGWVGTHDDVTERLRTEALVKEQNERLRAREEELAVQNGRFGTAIENMSQGLCFFDGDMRLIVCNTRFAELYGLAPEQVRPGTTLREILGHRAARGTAPKGRSLDEYLRWSETVVRSPAASDALVELADGRAVAIHSEPTPGGGWVGTHDDVTERLRAEALIKEQNERLRQREEELAVQNGRFHTAIENIGQGLCFFDGAGRLIVCNKRYAELYGLDPGQVAPGTTLREIVGRWIAAGTGPKGMTAEEYLGWCGRVARAAGPSAPLVELADGRLIQIYQEPLPDGGWVATHDDATERLRTEAALLAQNERFDAALTNMSQGLCMFDADTRLVVHNERFLELYGLPPGAVRPGQTHREVVERTAALGLYAPGQSADEICANTRALVERGGADAAVQYRDLADGRTLAIATRAMSRGGWVATFEDVTERRRAEARIAHMARHDALTGLPNRAFFHERLEALLRPLRNRPAAPGAEAGGDGTGGVAVLWLDLDRFKHVNDTLGHPAGDALLKAVAGRIAAAARGARGEGGGGATIARLGGDEFALAVPVAGDGPAARADAAALAARLVAVLNEPFEIDGQQVVAGASAGLALAPEDGDCPDRLVKAADLALYRAKAEGRGTFRCFEPEMDRHARARLAMETDLRRALAAGEFEVHYQPLLDLRTDRVSGFEALLRWNHPERGRVSPAEFVPVAEEIGLIGPIGDWVLRAACAEAATWPGGLKVAVNLSPAQFRNRGLVPSVAEALSASRLPPGRLELEITETVLLESTEQNVEQLHRLRALGARIAMDDFGTGHSSLSYLRSFPFDKIKIDRSFVRDLERDGEGGSAAIIRAVAGLGASLGVHTTAEGVETAAQLAFVRAEGCTEVQGYHLSPPRPAAEISRMLRSIGAGAGRVAAEAL